MKMAIISDIHGNYPALCAVLEQVKKMSCSLIISLGDIAGYYCMLNECIDICRRNGVINILGNHDHYLINGVECMRSMTANVCLKYQKGIILPENLEWLRASILEYRMHHYWFVHGGWSDLLEQYVDSIDFTRFSDCGATLLASGHTHIQTIQKNDGITYINPGSVGQPRDGDPRAAFAIIDIAGDVTLCRVEYDIDSIANAMKIKGFERRYYDGLYSGTKIQQFDRQ